MAEFETFPKEIVWIPTANGWTHRAATKMDEKRRGLVKRLLSRPPLPRGARYTLEQMHTMAEEKAGIREQLDELPKPYE